MELIHIRLREEIERVYGVTRGALAKAARDMGMPSVQELSDVVGERKRISANLLAQVATIGVDVAYVVTGERSGSAAKAKLPGSFYEYNGQVMLTPQQLCRLLNMWAEQGKGNRLLWGEALLIALDGYQPKQPDELVIQRFVQHCRHGRRREVLALYLATNTPGVPWFIWPSEEPANGVFHLDTGEDTLPFVVPDVKSMPAPALALDGPDLQQCKLGGALIVGWEDKRNHLSEPPTVLTTEEAAAKAAKTERAMLMAFFKRYRSDTEK